MVITVRPAVEGDVPTLLSLFAQLHSDDPSVPAEVAADVWQRIAAQEGRVILVAECDGAVAGTVDCTVLPNLTRGARPFMLVENVVVDGRMRRRGLGAALFDAVIGMAKRTGCYKIQLLTGAKRTAAHDFYEAQGLKPMAQGFRLYL